MNYFNKIPTINYSNYTAKNIMARARLSDNTKNTKSLFYPYTMVENDRIDNLSNIYYGNPGYTWLIWMANETVDPYYQGPLAEQDFYNFIVMKYGAWSKAEEKIAFYRTNWFDNPDNITVQSYEDLPSSRKKYWNPQLNINFQTIGYERKQEDIIANTNRVVDITYTSINGKSFIEGEKITFNASSYGYCVTATSGSLTIQHVRGSFATIDSEDPYGIYTLTDIDGNDILNSTITGAESGATGTITKAVAISSTDALVDSPYWEPVSYLTYEREENEKKKEIQLIDVRYKNQIEDELQRIMSQ